MATLSGSKGTKCWLRKSSSCCSSLAPLGVRYTIRFFHRSTVSEITTCKIGKIRNPRFKSLGYCLDQSTWDQRIYKSKIFFSVFTVKGTIVHQCTRGVMIPLFPGSGSGIGIAKRLRIQLWIRTQGWNHNTSVAVTNPLFSGSGSWIRIARGPKMSLNPTPEPDPGPES